jgi:hypothetical protein
MSTTDRTVALVSWWVATYSRHLPAEVAERRQGELASDLWEQRAYGRAVGAPAPAVALSILRRMTAGMPADLRWRQRQLAATRGRPLGARGQPVLRTLARTWWLMLAGLVGSFEVAFGVAIPEEGANFDTVGGGALIATAGLLVLGGIAVRRRRSRVAGDSMIAVGALPTVPFFWMILPPLAGLTVIVAAAFDAAEARSLGQRGTPLVAGERLVLAGVVIVAAALVAAVVIGMPIPGTLIVAPVLLALVIYLGLRQRRRPA